MYQTRLCLGVSTSFELGTKEQIALFQKVGFEAFFTEWSEAESVKEIREYADSIGMIYQSIHAPFKKAAKMWQNGDDAEDAVNELIRCVQDCADNGVPIMVCHAFIGFKDHTPTEEGIENFRRVVLAAREKGVRIAFENTEGEEYLAALMRAFSECENVGFCWDTGHEMCYNQSRDMMALYGDRLLCTHINDNLGIKDYGGNITWHDDLHLLPFDGVADWADIAARLNRHGYDDILTFELTRKSKPNRVENDVYAKMAIEDYLAEVYKRACRIATMKMKGKTNA